MRKQNGIKDRNTLFLVLDVFFLMQTIQFALLY